MDQVELIIVLLVAVLEYSAYVFILVQIVVTRKTYFSGCTYLNKTEKLRLKALGWKIRYWSIAFLVDFLCHAYVLWGRNFNTVDLIRYVSGKEIRSTITV